MGMSGAREGIGGAGIFVHVRMGRPFHEVQAAKKGKTKGSSSRSDRGKD